MPALADDLQRPTTRRFKKIIDRTTLVAALLYLSVGIFGCIQFWTPEGGVRSNILLNYSSDDPLLFVGRVALTFTVSTGISLMVHPCRGAVRNIARNILSAGAGERFRTGDRAERPPAPEASCAGGTTRSTVEAFLLQLTAGVSAIYIPEVTTVWSILGSTVCMLVSFVFPAACYLSIRRRSSWTTCPKCWASIALLVWGIVMCVVCTIQSAVEVLT